MRHRVYYQNSYSLTFQFIVSEYLNICQFFKICSQDLHKQDSHHIKQALTKLIGPLHEDLLNSNLHCTYNTGILSKLQNSCYNLYLCDTEDRSAQKLNEYTQKILSLNFQIQKISIKENQTAKFLLQIESFLAKIQKSLKDIGQIIAKLFLQFANDEAILLFLMQNHHLINSFYHPQFVTELFSKMFSSGIEEAEKYTIKKYSQRGYQQLLPQISA